MATILAHITVNPGRENRFEELARTLYAATNEREPGVRRYEYWRGAEPRTYYTLLSFADYAAFLAHQTSPHHEGAASELGPVIAAMQIEWVDPIAGASPLPPSEEPSHPLPVTDDRTRRYAAAFPPAIAPWWLAQRAEGDSRP